MTFANPLWLLLLALAPIIPLLHSRNRRNVEVSSLFLWRRLTETPRPKAHRSVPRPNLLMLLQLLVLVAVALALARPERSGRAGADHWIVMLDASSAMGARDGGSTAFEAARNRLGDDLRAIDGGPARISLVRVTSRPTVVAARLRNPADVGDALSATRPSDEPADWNGAAALLPGLMVGGEAARITVLSDALGAGDARRALETAVPDLPIETIAPARPVENLALAAVTVVPAGTGAGRWRVTGEVRASPPPGESWRPRSVPLEIRFRPEGGSGAEEEASWTLRIERAGVVGFQGEVSARGAGVLSLALPGDRLASDDEASFVLPGRAGRARVLYVGPGSEPLQRAFAAVPGVELTRAAALPADAASYDLVVLDRVAPAGRVAASTLWIGVAPGAAEAPLLPDARPGGWMTADHPLTRSVDWEGLEITAARRLPRLPGAELLLEAAGAPLVQARTTEDGREVVLAFRPDDSNWPDLVAFPTFVANLVDWVAPGAGRQVTPPCIVGEACTLDLGARTAGWRVLDPDGAPVALPAAGAAAIPRRFEQLFRPERAGLYTLVSGGTRQPIAVNPALSALSPGVGAGDAAESRGAPAPIRLAWWSALLLLGLAALLVETWIAGRKTERFLLREGLARENPLAPRRRGMLALRGAALLLLALALARLPAPYPLRRAGAAVVVANLEGPGDELARVAPRRVGEVRAGDLGHVERDLGAAGPNAPGPEVSRGIDLETSLLLAGALLPPGDPGRVVLVTDGSETRGDAAAALPRLLERGVPIDVLPLPAPRAGETLVESLIAPPSIHEREAVELQGIIRCYCPSGTSASVRLRRDGVVASERRIQLTDGRNRVRLPVTEERRGRYLYEIEVIAGGDGVVENNRGGASLDVVGSPRVAIVSPQASWGRTFADALAVQGVTARVLTPAAAFPAATAGRAVTADADLVVLMNTPAADVPPLRQAELERWVREQGGGLLLLGGENSFGPGGYFDTPLETLSPLSAKIPPEIPSVAILFILDRSGSMLVNERGASRLDVAKQATLEAASVLDPESLVGVIAFDNEAEIVAPLQRADDPVTLRAGIMRFQGQGGTNIYPALALGFETLRQVDPKLSRHLVVMTDGLSQPGDFDTLLPRIAAEGITVSGVAIGEGADSALVAKIARLGGGASYVDEDFQALPRILAEDAKKFSRQPIKEETVQPTWSSRDAAFLQAMPRVPPPLQGYVQTGAKPGATLHLVGGESAPLLASWRYGLGRVVGFASHGAGPWAAAWVADPAYPLWWSQIARWALAGAAGSELRVELRRQGDDARILVEALAGSGAPRRGLDLVATVTTPDSTRMEGVRLRESEPGIYQGDFVADRPGAYRVAVSTATDAPSEGMASAEQVLYVAYPARYDLTRVDTAVTYALARLSGGRVMRPGDPVLLGAARLSWAWRSGWPLWSLLALACFFADLLLRYLPGRSRRDRTKSGAETSSRPRSRVA